jgi:alpha-ketoglutarate-dependent taurine dioxygenase
MTRSKALEIQPITPVVGAVASGVDITAPLDPETVRDIRQAVLDHGAVFFRGQAMSREQMMAFTRHFGTPCVDPFSNAALTAAPGRGAIYDMPTLAYSKATALWHIDSTLAATPASMIALRALELPAVGGDTCWGSMYAAYDTLAEPIRDMIDGLSAEHSAFKVLPLMGAAAKELQEEMRNIHPVVRVHPETGRKALFVNELWTESIVGFSPNESTHLLAMLYEHARSQEFTMRWKWSVNDLVLWDNCAFQHYAVRDYQTTRVMQKTLLAGDRPYGPRDALRGGEQYSRAS